MKQEFVPYELALKLKQLGFDEPCFVLYKASNNNQLAYAPHGITTNSQLSQGDSSNIAAPTFSQAFRWFRENYLYHPHFFSKEDGTFAWCIRWYIDGLQKDTPYFSSNTYEEAELACLDKLIDIITKQQEQ
jgi:hypothetical protein